jgi:triosephosphate isomerase (TIM)
VARRALILNFKNYPRISGGGSVRLASFAKEVSEDSGVTIIVAPPTPLLALVASTSGGHVYAQSVDAELGDRATGSVLPETVRSCGARGTLLNHSESRKPASVLRTLVPRLSRIGLEVCLCARTPSEAARLARFGTEFLAVEPPALIGTGVAVSRARPEVITESVEAVEKAGFKGALLCGAGIVDAGDVAKALKLGADGVLVSSSVVKADDWKGKLAELAGAF